MEVMKKVLVVGSATIDIMLKSNDFRILKSHQVAGGVAMCEVYGGKTEANEMVVVTGGAGTNVAVGLSLLGFTTASLVRVGDDWMRERILDNLKFYGVETSLVQTEKGGKTALSVILVAVGGGRSIITYRGASRGIDSTKIDWDKVANSDWVQISALGGNMVLLEDLVSFAKSRGIRIGWNPGKGELAQRDKVIALLPKVELLILNRMEAATLLRHGYDDMETMAEKILASGVKMVAITDGKMGAGVGGGGFWISAKAFKTKSVDDTGAGDAFTAGLVAGILSEKDLADALKMGLSNGASEVTEMGAKKGLLTSDEMKKWMKKKLKIVEERF